MPFSRKNKAIDYKARLEYKLYLAREDPDLIFDLSDCDLKNVPKGIYCICKVLRKESLILKQNNLTSLSGGGSLEDLSLLHVLDIRCNNLPSLPESIQYLVNLKELYLNNNLIKYLPESIVTLKNLKILSTPFNRLKRLPQNIDQLSMLEELSVQGNPALCILPNSLSLCPRLSRLVIDVGRYTHPPDDVVLKGSFAVLSYLASKLGFEYKGVQEFSSAVPENTSSSNDKSLSPFEQQIQAKLEEFERKKENKQKECLALEKELADQKDKEVLLQNELKKEKQKLVEDLKKQQMKIAEEVLRFQNQKEVEREKLIQNLKQAESEADSVIAKMLEMNRASREPWCILQQKELDRAAEQLIFQQRFTGDLKRKEIINDMESLLNDEKSKLVLYEESRNQMIKDSLLREAEWDETVMGLLHAQTKFSLDFEGKLEAMRAGNPAGQEAAVATLLERNDLESGRLRAQLGIIEQQLAHITATELQRSRLNLDHMTCELSERRCKLSFLLMDVLNQREARKSQLLSMLRRMEAVAAGEEDYWLVQYQKLLESQASLDPALVRAMVLGGLHRHLPLLVNIDLHQLSAEYLHQAGVDNEEEVTGISKTVRNYLAETTVEPSAPYDDGCPSAPNVEYEAECVVCMATECQVVFLPCGHLCCCKSCSQHLVQCPLCRGDIDSKVLIMPVT